MKITKNYVLADAGCMVSSSEGPKGIKIPYTEGAVYTEAPFETVYRKSDDCIDVSGVLLIKIGAKDIKSKLIKLWYTNDDQIAVMLNKDKGGSYLDDYNRMQGWRKWAGEVAAELEKFTTNNQQS